MEEVCSANSDLERILDASAKAVEVTRIQEGSSVFMITVVLSRGQVQGEALIKGEGFPNLEGACGVVKVLTRCFEEIVDVAAKKAGCTKGYLLRETLAELQEMSDDQAGLS